MAVECEKIATVKLLLAAGADTSDKYLASWRVEGLMRGPSAVVDGRAITTFTMLLDAGCCLPDVWYAKGGFEREIARLCKFELPDQTLKRKLIFARYFQPQKLL